MVLPESRVREQKYHHIRDIVLTDSVVKGAALIVILYVATFAVGTLAGLLAGFPLSMAAFESASATGNVGLSIGVTTAAMPAFLKIVYIVIMWLARLEFLSVFALISYVFRKAAQVCAKKPYSL